MKYSNHLSLNVEDLIAQGMGPALHWFPADVSTSRLATALVGMANADGGTVLLGVAPRSGEIQGVRQSGELIDRVFQAALLADPSLVLPLPRLVRTKRSQVLWITVPAGLPHVYSLDGRYLGREGPQTVPLPPRSLRRLLLERGVVQFESLLPPGATLADLDDQKVSSFVSALNLPGDQTTEELLLRRGGLGYAERKAATGEALEPSRLYPTYAGLLLLGHYPQRWLPNATILAARFSGSTLADRFFKQDIGGALPEQLRLAEAFVRENVRNVVRLVGFTHEETSEYPLAAVRELLVNAIVHRDYNVQGDNIHLYIFTDRIEVHSPGGLPGPVNLGNLLEARFSRNAVIVQALSDLGYVERLGYGLNRVVEVMRQNGLQPPKFEETAGTFRVTLYAEQAQPAIDLPRSLEYYQALELNSRQQMALSFLARRRRITNREFQELCPEVHSETLRRDLVDLVERDILIKVGEKRATYYILKR